MDYYCQPYKCLRFVFCSSRVSTRNAKRPLLSKVQTQPKFFLFFFFLQTTPCLATISYYCLSNVTQKEHTLQKHGKTLTPSRLCMSVRMHGTGMTKTFQQPKNCCSKCPPAL